MPWTSPYYPTSMKNLPPIVRGKAIEIANALMDEGMDEGRAIRIAITKTKEWHAAIGRKLGSTTNALCNSTLRREK